MGPALHYVTLQTLFWLSRNISNFNRYILDFFILILHTVIQYLFFRTLFFFDPWSDPRSNSVDAARNTPHWVAVAKTAMNLLKPFTLNTLSEFMKIEKKKIYIYGNCLLYEELVLRWRTLSTEIFRVFPAPFDFSLFSRNIELFIGQSQRYQKGEKQKYVCILGLMLSNLLPVILTEFWSRFLKPF